MRPLVAGNWKMNGTAASLAELGSLKDALAAKAPACDVLICPPATLLAQANWKAQGAFALGGQDCHAKPSGAFTGDVSAEMLKDAGASYVIVGHSERRQYHRESDADVAAKALGAWRAGLKAIICIGEPEAQRLSCDHNNICGSQLDGSVPADATADNTLIAYEPVWAIGTGQTATREQAQEVHLFLRGLLTRLFEKNIAESVRILYGGSVKPDNIDDLMAQPDIDGALVGGAALNAESFSRIVHFQ